MSQGIRKTKDGFSQQMKDMITRSKSAQGGFARIYALYQKFQLQRFMSTGSSEEQNWATLSKDYAQSKLRIFGGGPRRASKKRAAGNWNSYPGNGRQMMIATGTLAGAVIGQGAPFSGTDRHRAMFTATSMNISVENSGQNGEGKPFNYGAYADQKRSLMKFSTAHIQQMKTTMRAFLVNG